MLDEVQLSKMHKVRKRELRRAITRLHETTKLSMNTERGPNVYGLRVAITILGKMRKEIDTESPTREGEGNVMATMRNKKLWRVWAWFWTAPAPRKWDDFATREEALKVAEQLNDSPSGKYTHYSVEIQRERTR